MRNVGPALFGALLLGHQGVSRALCPRGRERRYKVIRKHRAPVLFHVFILRELVAATRHTLLDSDHGRRFPKRLIRPSRLRTRSPESNGAGINDGSASEYGLGGDTFRRHGYLLAQRRVPLASCAPVVPVTPIGRTVTSLPCSLPSTISAVIGVRPAVAPGIWLVACEMRSTADSNR